MKDKKPPSSNFSCFPKADYDPHLRPLTNFFREESEWQNSEFNIFLTETSCNPRPRYRAWCSVESMAKQNPKAIVWYVMTSPEVDTQDGLVERLLEKYTNLRVVTMSLEEVFRGTPLQELYDSGAWYIDTKWPAANLGDMMRMALVWNVGGFYSDTDIICIAPVTGLRNVIGLESFNLVNGAAFHFDRHHPILKHFMVYLSANFDPYEWGKNGPQAVSAVLRFVCKDDILSQSLKCQDVKILGSQAFYPIRPSMQKVLFYWSSEKDMKRRFPKSYTIHLWNKDSSKLPIVKDSGSIADLASAAYCPMSREEATRYSHIY